MTYHIHQGNSLAILQSLPANSVDAVITDPPYSSGGTFAEQRVQGSASKYVIDRGQEMAPDFFGENRDQRSYAAWCTLWLAECFRVAKDGAMLAVFIDWRQLPLMTDVVQGGGWTWRGIVPWNKTEGARPSKGWFRSQCEYIVTCSKGATPATMRKPAVENYPAMPGFFVCSCDENPVHQTQKPVDLMRWLCQLVPKGGVILDPFMGSGTTGVGATMEGIDFIGIELSEHYAEVARGRIAGAVQGGSQETIGLGA